MCNMHNVYIYREPPSAKYSQVAPLHLFSAPLHSAFCAFEVGPPDSLCSVVLWLLIGFSQREALVGNQGTKS